jgi:hypothetical protein
MTNQEIIEYQKEMKRWSETKVGAAFLKFENLLGKAWVTDQRETASDKAMRDAWAKSYAARQEVIAAIKELQERGE